MLSKYWAKKWLWKKTKYFGLSKLICVFLGMKKHIIICHRRINMWQKQHILICWYRIVRILINVDFRVTLDVSSLSQNIFMLLFILFVFIHVSLMWFTCVLNFSNFYSIKNIFVLIIELINYPCKHIIRKAFTWSSIRFALYMYWCVYLHLYVAVVVSNSIKNIFVLIIQLI